MNKTKKFPRTFRSSSAAYRAIRQYEEKTGQKSSLVMTKMGDKQFNVSLPIDEQIKMKYDEFMEKLPSVSYGDVKFKYYPDGLTETKTKDGYYELKTGDRRRPTSQFKTPEEVYSDFINEVCL